MRFRRIFLTLVAVVTLVVSGTSMIRTVRSFYRLDFPVSWVEEGLVVAEVPQGSTAEVTGFAKGDMVVEIDGVSIASIEDPAFVLAGGDEHALTVLHTDGGLSEYRYRSPPPAINSVYLARSVVGIFALACALFVVWTTDRRETTTFLLLAAAAVIMGAVPNRIAMAELTLQVIRRGAGAALPFLIARFFVIFPERDRSMRTFDFLTLIAVVASGATALLPEADAWWPVVASFLRVLFGLSLIFGIILQIRRWRAAAREALIRRQIEWAALGLFVGSRALFHAGDGAALDRDRVRAVCLACGISDHCHSADPCRRLHRSTGCGISSRLRAIRCRPPWW